MVRIIQSNLDFSFCILIYLCLRKICSRKAKLCKKILVKFIYFIFEATASMYDPSSGRETSKSLSTSSIDINKSYNVTNRTLTISNNTTSSNIQTCDNGWKWTLSAKINVKSVWLVVQ